MLPRNMFIGGPAQTTVALSSAGTLTATCEHPIRLGRLWCGDGSAGPGIGDIYLKLLTICGDPVLSGIAPATMLHPEAVNSPVFGHDLQKNDKVILGVHNTDAGTAALLTFGGSEFDPDYRGPTLREGRSLVIVGQTDPATPTSIVAGTTDDFEFSVEEPCVLGRLFADVVVGSIDNLFLTQAFYNGRQLFQGVQIPLRLFSPFAVMPPIFDGVLRTNDTLKLTVAAIGTAATPVLAFSTI